MRIPGIAQAEIEAIEGAGGAEAAPRGLPTAVVPGEPAVVARSRVLEYRDHGLEWQLSGKNGF